MLFPEFSNMKIKYMVLYQKEKPTKLGSKNEKLIF